MSNSLYEEAIADAMAIREAAESRAKQNLIESMTPQIKDLVEKKLMEELGEEDQVECGMSEDEQMKHEEEQSEHEMSQSEIDEISLEEDDPDALENDKD